MATPSQRVAVEQSLRLYASTESQLLTVRYLKILRDIRYNKLLIAEPDQQQALIGELRLLQKLLSVLENGGSTLEDQLS